MHICVKYVCGVLVHLRLLIPLFHTGKYQSSSNLAELKSRWQPSDMLPKMYKDREIRIKREEEAQQKLQQK